jgi:hypothetical protein
MRVYDWILALLCFMSPLAFAQPTSVVSAQTQLAVLNSPPKAQGVGLRSASHAAVGKVTAMPISYVEAVVIGIAIITNNNDNDGQPGTFTGGSGSNMAAGG